MYRRKVTFTETDRYGCGPGGEDDVYTVAEFRERCSRGWFVDSDGYGYPVKRSLADDRIGIKPSNLSTIPDDATHVVWFNR